MSALIRCDMCGKERPVDVHHGWLRLQHPDGQAVPGGKYPPLPRDFCTWRCAARYTADVIGKVGILA